MKAWYFSNKDRRLRFNDGRKIKRGITHTITGKPKRCYKGLHGSVDILDALYYAPGAYIWRVDITEEIDKGDDKLCGKSRKYLYGFDATEVLREFARKQALINIDKIKPYCSTEIYKLIVNYLKTGAARSAAWSAAESAAWSAAESAAESARSAAWSAAESARSIAESAARSAARSAVESAADSAARSAGSAAWSATLSAAWSEARSAANEMLENMIVKEAKKRGLVQ